MSQAKADTPRRRGTKGHRHKEYCKERIRKFIGKKVQDDLTFYLNYKLMQGGLFDVDLPSTYDVTIGSQKFQDWKKKKLLEEFQDLEEFIDCNSEAEALEIISAGIVASLKIEEAIEVKINEDFQTEESKLDEPSITVIYDNILWKQTECERFLDEQELETIDWYKNHFDRHILETAALYNEMLNDECSDPQRCEEKFLENERIRRKHKKTKDQIISDRGLDILYEIDRDIKIEETKLVVSCETLFSEGKVKKKKDKIYCEFKKTGQMYIEQPKIISPIGEYVLHDVNHVNFETVIKSHSEVCSIPQKVLEIMIQQDKDLERRVKNLANYQICTCLDYFKTGFKMKRLQSWIRMLIKLFDDVRWEN